MNKYFTHKREPFFEIAKERIKKGDTILDVGSGNGSFAEYCQDNNMFLFEGNNESVKFLKSKFSNVYQGRLPKLPFKDDFFNVIHMSHVIEHLNSEEVYETLKELDRCCKPNGYIIISAPLMWDGFYDDLSHIRPYTPQLLIRYMCNASNKNFSRPKISSNYTNEKLQYRYKLNNGLLFKPSKDKLFAKAFFKLKTYIENNFLKTYSKTGFTLVLKKNI